MSDVPSDTVINPVKAMGRCPIAAVAREKRKQTGFAGHRLDGPNLPYSGGTRAGADDFWGAPIRHESGPD